MLRPDLDNPYGVLEATQRAYDGFVRTTVRNYFELRTQPGPPEIPASIQQVASMLWENVLRAKHACYEYETWKRELAKASEINALRHP